MAVRVQKLKFVRVQTKLIKETNAIRLIRFWLAWSVHNSEFAALTAQSLPEHYHLNKRIQFGLHWWAIKAGQKAPLLASLFSFSMTEFFEKKTKFLLKIVFIWNWIAKRFHCAIFSSANLRFELCDLSNPFFLSWYHKLIYLKYILNWNS